MKKIIDADDLKKIEDRVASFETNTGVELIIAVAENSDPYPAAGLRFAFVLSLLLSAIFLHYIEIPANMVLGLYLMLFFMVLPLARIKRLRALAISSIESAREVKEKALEVFYEKAITKDSKTPVVLIYTSWQERRIEIIAHPYLTPHFDQKDWGSSIDKVIPLLRKNQYSDAILGITADIESKFIQKLPELKNQLTGNSHRNQVLFIDGF